MAQVIEFTANPQDRCIESIPPVRRLAYHFHVNDRLVEVGHVERFGEWVWATRDCRWWDRDYMTGGKGFESAAEAAQDALNRIVASNIE